MQFTILTLGILLMCACNSKNNNKQSKNIDKIKIQFQYFEGCPMSDSLLINVKKAILGMEEKILLEEIIINTSELAKKYSFRGSPTVLINNIDLENMFVPLNPELSCRYYSKGLPTVEEIKEKINKISNIEIK